MFEQETLAGTTALRYEPSRYLMSKAALLKPLQTVLLVADGEGRNSVWCAELGLEVDAFDISSTAVDRARQLAEEKGVRVTHHVACCEAWQWKPEQYDAVVLICANFASPDIRQTLFNNCAKTLKTGGILIVKGFSNQQLAVMMYEGISVAELEHQVNGYTIADHFYSKALLEDAFDNFEILEINRYLQKGRKEDGTIVEQALIGMVARKV